MSKSVILFEKFLCDKVCAKFFPNILDFPPNPNF